MADSSLQPNFPDAKPNSKLSARLQKIGLAIAALIFLLIAAQVLLQDHQALILGLILVGGGTAWYSLNSLPTQSKASDSPIANRQSLQQQIQLTQQFIVKIDDLPQRQQLLDKANRIANHLEQNQLHIVLVGNRAVGKTALLQALVGNSDPESSGLPLFAKFPTGIFSSGAIAKRKVLVVEVEQVAEILLAAQVADLLVFVVEGDLIDSEYQVLGALADLSKPLVLAFNKIDLYLPIDQEQIFAQLEARTASFLNRLNLVAIAAQPNPIKVRQYANTPDAPGALLQEWLEPQLPQVETLKQRLEEILSQEWENLLYQNLQNQARSLQAEAETQLNQIRRRQAEPIICRYQWLNAGAMFVNPIPALDLVASTAVNVQLLIDLGNLYDRRFSLSQANQLGAIIGKNLLQLGCIEVATTAIASCLKTNTLTYAIGGTSQAICAAYVTRLGAQSFLDYLEQTQDQPTQAQKSTAPNQLFNQSMTQTINTLRELCQSNFLKTQGSKVFAELVSNFGNIATGANPTGLHP